MYIYSLINTLRNVTIKDNLQLQKVGRGVYYTVFYVPQALYLALQF